MFDTLRTVPVQASLIAMNTLAMTPALGELPDIGEALANPSAVNLAPIALNGLMAVSKLRLRDRVEDVINERGYDERLIKASSVSYCGRQATKMACQKTGHLDEFFETVDDPDYSKMFPQLPHP